jgi:hypothetical protein
MRTNPVGHQSCFPSMSYETRMKGFVGCFIIGWILSFCSVIAISIANINGFVLLYSFGNAVSIFATMFLMGPLRQLKSMFAPVRLLATLVFLGMLVTTIVVAIQTQNFVIVLVCVLLQFVAGLWYAISYIPYGEYTLSKGNCCRTNALRTAREMILSLCFNRGGV